MASFTESSKAPVVYTITNLINNKVYIGITCNFKQRKYEHFSLLIKKAHPNKYLQNSFNKVGQENLVMEILEECCSSHILLSQENYWCNLLRSHEEAYGYNIRMTHPEGKIKQTEETKRKISLKNKGRKRLDNCWVGRTHSKESKEKMSLSKLGKLRSPHSLNTKLKISNANIGKSTYSGWRDKPVIQLNLDGDFIREWTSAKEASRNLKISQGNISSVLNGKRKIASQFIWKYKNI